MPHIVSDARPVLAVAALLALCSSPSAAASGASRVPASDLDAFMERVLARRDENWKKLQQYVLDERERIEVLAPGRVRLYGLDREYTWYIRDGAFVRSPVRFDGVALSEEERRRYETAWLERERRRDQRRAERGDAPPQEAADLQGLLSVAKEPRFVSSAYFLKFRFEPGRYALAGRETFAGRDVLRIEYYPERLFADDEKKGREGTGDSRDREDTDSETRLEHQMNKVALVTLWVDPATHQILQYTFDNVGMDFLPGRSIVRVDELRASMRMGEAFPGVWLPDRIDGRAGITLASGTYELRFDVDYHDYRQADVKARVR